MVGAMSRWRSSAWPARYAITMVPLAHASEGDTLLGRCAGAVA
jgi:hypothetical protein